MGPPVIDVRSADDPRDVVHQAVQALAEGKVVAFPTETVYGIGASAMNAAAVERVYSLKGRSEDQPLALAIKSAEEAWDYVPQMPPLAQRLARRCWPGPITLVLDDVHPDSLLRQLPSKVQQSVAPRGTVGLRVPANHLLLSVLRLTAGPIALTSANRNGEPEARTAQEVVSSFGHDVDLILDDGRSQFGQPSSVVRVEGHQLTLLRPGVINEKSLQKLASMIILLVCTGNTCRSPMAEKLMQRRVAEQLGCSIRELEERGVMILSAGISAMAGGRASPEAVQVLAQQGLDLSLHESQPLADRLVRFADLILTMTRGHREAILAQWPDAEPRTKLLSRDGRDISDPIGGPYELYQACAQQIDNQVSRWAPELDYRSLPPRNGEQAASKPPHESSAPPNPPPHGNAGGNGADH
jgi:protein-tyrosine phosphatase